MSSTPQVGFYIFRIVLPLLLLVIQYMLYRRARRWVAEVHPGKRWLDITVVSSFLIFNLALAFVAVARPRLMDFPGWLVYAGVYPFFLWHGSTFFIGLVLLIVTLIKLPFLGAWWASKKIPGARSRIAALTSREGFRRFAASRRAFLRTSMYGLTAASFGGSIYGMIVEKTSHEVTEEEFPVAGLPPELAGFTIALVSDIHSSVFMTKTQMDEYVKVTNDIGADLIAVTGDFVNSMTDEVYPFAESFSALRAPHGVFGVMGNHDFFAQNPELVAREINACGIRLLRDEQVIIEKNGGRLQLLGVDDTGRPQRAAEKMDRALGGVSLPLPKVLLCHRPYFLDEASERNINLVLSGHTHGGQVVLGQFGETLIAPARLASRFIWGKYRIGSTDMFVTRGIGTVGLPIRINCPPEIVRITLVPA